MLIQSPKSEPLVSNIRLIQSAKGEPLVSNTCIGLIQSAKGEPLVSNIGLIQSPKGERLVSNIVLIQSQLCPPLSKILTNTYRDDIDLFINGETIYSQEGTTQGDPLAMAMYAIAITPLINALESESMK